MRITDQMPAEAFPPGEFLQEELEARGWSQADLADILGKTPKTVNEIVLGKRRVTPEMARLLSKALGTSASYWLNLESLYQLYKAERTGPCTDDVSRRAVLYEKYPVRDMIRRGWIEETDNVDVLESQLDRFHSRQLPFAARRREDLTKEPFQLAWLHRVRNLAEKIRVDKFSELKLQEAFSELRVLLPSAEEVRRVPEILRKAGVRFLVVEPFPGSKIDGVCLWLDARSPVVAVSLRYDRIDYFWFTLLHELHHVKFGHAKKTAILDTNVMEDNDVSAEEHQADQGATAFLVPKDEVEDFIARVRPLFSTSQIKGFSRRIGVHMGIVVGQLQYRGLIDYSRNRNALVKVRNILTQTAFCDGWGMTAYADPRTRSAELVRKEVIPVGKRKDDYHVVPKEDGWAVRKEGASRASSLHSTQRDAISAGRDLARRNQTELVIHRPNGQIRDSDSYGNDPCPPKDKKF